MSGSRPNATTQHFVMRSVAEAAQETGVPEATIQAWIEEGHLPAARIGRTDLVDVLAVQSLSLRPPRDVAPADRDWFPNYLRGRPWLRALGTANILGGAGGMVVFAGVEPDDLRTGWWLALCLANILVALVEAFGLRWGATRATPRRAGRSGR